MAGNIIKDLGVVTAYAYAVLHGYTGTEEEFTQEIGNASINAQAAAISSEEAESWAKGTKGGTPVESSDPAYHNSSKYYSEQAADSASGALSAKDAAVAAAATASSAYDVNLLAPNYTDLTFPVKAGQLCIYSGGLYRAKADIASSESWTDAHWETATIGEDVQEIRDSIDVLSGQLTTYASDVSIFMQNRWATATGEYAINAYTIRTKKYIPTEYIESALGVSVNAGYEYALLGWKTDGTYMGVWNGSAFSKSDGTYHTIPIMFSDIGDGYKFAFNLRRTTAETAIDISDGVNLLFLVPELQQKLDVDQGMENAGKILAVGSDGKVTRIENAMYRTGEPTPPLTFELGAISTTGAHVSYSNTVVSSPFQVSPGDYITADDGYYIKCTLYSSSDTRTGTFIKYYNWTSGGRIDIDASGYAVVQISDADHYSSYSNPLPDTSYQEYLHIFVTTSLEQEIDKLSEEMTERLQPLGYLSAADVYTLGEPDPYPTFVLGTVSAKGALVSYRNTVRSSVFIVSKGDYITADEGYYIRCTLYSAASAGTRSFLKQTSWTNSGRVDISLDGYCIAQISDSEHYSDYNTVLPDTSYKEHLHITVKISSIRQVSEIKDALEENRTMNNFTGLYAAQRAIARDWHLPFIDMYDEMGLGNNHQIPGTARTWSQSGTTDLTQKDTWMRDGTHPYRGVGLVDMYGRTIANRMALISPSYHDGAGQTSPSYWAGKRFLWMGTSIPAGSDPDAGDGDGATYPALVAEQLGAYTTNIAKGSSRLRIATSAGNWAGTYFSHFLRSVTRTDAEVDAIVADWANIYPQIPNAPSTLSESNINTMRIHSYQNLLIPYLDGRNTLPDAVVIDYGHNDTANGVDGKRDFWVQPTLENIRAGILAEDTYMTANDYANLKLAFDNDLSGITDLAAFSASVNRNCFQGACNFLITAILRYQPYMRIIMISDYN